MNQVKFHLHYVTNGTTKARVHYSLDNHVSGKPCVILYAKDYDGRLGNVFPGNYRNDSDMMIDYFDKGRVRLFADNPFYKDARAVAEKVRARIDAKRDAIRKSIEDNTYMNKRNKS